MAKRRSETPLDDLYTELREPEKAKPSKENSAPSTSEDKEDASKVLDKTQTLSSGEERSSEEVSPTKEPAADKKENSDGSKDDVKEAAEPEKEAEPAVEQPVADDTKAEEQSGVKESSLFSLPVLSDASVVKTPFGSEAPAPVAEDKGEEPVLSVSGFITEDGSPAQKGHRPQTFPGEEDEELEFCDHNSILLKVNIDKETKVASYVRKGTGVVRLLKEKSGDTKDARRLVFRQSGTWKVLLNSPVKSIGTVSKSDIKTHFCVSFTALDTEAEPHSLAAYRLKFVDGTQREELYKLLKELTTS
eukprot:Blabericola_migrator_1__12585@NODE_7_length_25668_cov_124_338502_g6_i0_p10_GENE_NODE_7_length_25668_cov_124_338502_g6_i0NODE_7_length_25668_cov_124_338502_g6_i0_p10_ORF_typecomplete_len303_score74_98Ran_BP1/PF00638_18/2_8e12Borrelia_P83/PF05262_11/0_034_NODE_7_length_25668_cov_124_338502_g6_i051846092